MPVTATMSPATASVHRLARQALEGEHLLDLRGAVIFAAVPQLDRLAGLDRAAADAADADASDVRVVVERRDLELQRRVRLALGRGHVVQDGFVQRAHVGLAARVIGAGPAFERRGVDHREVELAIGGAELVEQFEGLVDDPVGARARTVDLVHDDDGVEAERQRLARDEARLRHRAFDRVDDQQHRVDHRQHAFHFAAEVGVPGRVDDVDARAAVFDGAVLRQDRDATFLFDVVRVHDALGDFLVRGEGAGLTQQAVDQRGLAMVDVRDDGDVANRAICHRTHGLSAREGARRPGQGGAQGTTWAVKRQRRGRSETLDYEVKSGTLTPASFECHEMRNVAISCRRIRATMPAWTSTTRTDKQSPARSPVSCSAGPTATPGARCALAAGLRRRAAPGAAADGGRTRRSHAATHGAGNEAFIRLAGQRVFEWQNREQFLSLAAQIMRRVLVDYARQRGAQRRGDGAKQLSLHDTQAAHRGRRSPGAGRLR